MSTTIYHKHHFIPKHMGGSDDQSNIMLVTVEEHARLHKFLYELFGHEQDYIAWKGLSGLLTNQECVAASLKLAGQKGYQRALKNIDRKGKTFEELYGTEKALEIKNKISRKADNNPCARTFEITHPDGSKEIVKSLKTWCEARELNYNSFHKMTISKRKSFKGYTAIKL